jgi:NAD(P)-dependent dehydrogenase (short-subunit alcohol dehydrogenase family)
VREAGGEAEAIVRRPDSLEDANAMLGTALKRFGRVDQLVVASGMNKPGFIHELAYEDWQAVMDANVRGIWFMAKAVGTHWIDKKQRGKVLVMSSVRGRHGNISGYTGYCASKGATDSLTRVLATEWAKHGITVNAISPTFVKTPQVEDLLADEAFREGLYKRIPLGRIAETDDVVGAVLLLCSDASAFITGQVLTLDGGLTACQ